MRISPGRRRWSALGLAVALTTGLVLAGGATASVASPALVAERLAQRTLDEVRAAASVTSRATAPSSEQAPDAPTPLATGSLDPDTESTVTAESTGTSVTFSGNGVSEHLDVTMTTPADTDATSGRQTAEAETGGFTASQLIEVTAIDGEGSEHTRFPARYIRDGGAPIDETSGAVSADPTDRPARATDVVPGVTLEIPVDDDAIAAHDLDPSTLTIRTREHAGDPWTPIPSYFDASTRTVRGEIDHLSQFVVIGIPKRASPRPRVVLDPDDDIGWATTPAPPVTELPYNIALANGVRALLAVQCLADVTITREDPAVPIVSHAMRAAIAASRNPDATVTLAFDAATGTAWDMGPTSGGSKSYPRGNIDDNALGDSFVTTLPVYTGRPARIVGDPRYPAPDFAGLPGAVAHLEALYLDNNYDRGVIDDPAGFQAIVNGTAKSIGDYLVSKGANCTSPVTGGWPAPPSAAEKERWRQLGYQNNQTYGADPVSFSTGNLVEDEPIFQLTGPGDQLIDLTLVYNAQDERESRAGIGWTFGVGARAQRFDDGSVMIVRGDGASFVFTANGGGGYVAEPGLHQTLAESASSPGHLLLTAVTGEAWEFDAADIDGIGELVRHTDRQGNTTTLGYGPVIDPDNARFVPLTSITDAAGQTIRVENDAVGHITAFVHPDGRRWSLGYDTGFHLTSIAAPDGRSRSFSYDAGHRMLTATDAAGVTYLRNEYDASGRVVKQYDAENNMRTFAYTPTPGGGQTMYTDNEGNTTTFGYDERHWITARTDAAGNTAHYDFDAVGQVEKYTDEAGRVWSYVYDAAGNVVRETQPDGSVVRSTYTPTGELASRTDQGGPAGSPRTTTFEISPQGQVAGVVQADGTHLANSYDASGNLVSSTTPSGATTRFAYDSRGNLTSTTDPVGATTTFSYDAANRVLSMTDALGAATTMVWDAGDRLVSRRDALGGITSYTYDANDHLTSSTDASGAVTRYEWDSLFRLVTVTDATGGTTRYGYNREDELTSSTDPLGAVTSFVLDELYRSVSVTDPNGGTWSRGYDAVGSLVSSTDPLGATTAYQYDDLGRLTRETNPLGMETRTTFDAVGRPVSTTDGAGNTTRYDYDLLDHLIATTDPTGAIATSTYDDDSRLVAATDRHGAETTFEHDGAGRLIAATDPLGAVTASVYDPVGRVTAQIDALGRATSFDYDALGRTVGVTDPLGATTTFAYDAIGRLLETTDPLGHVSSQAYTPTGAVRSATDALGAVRSYAYDGAGRQVSMIDPLGNETRYSYDPVGQLTAVVEGFEAAAQPDADTNVRSSYSYTATGSLAATSDPNGNTTHYAYDAAGHVTSETNPLGSTWNYRYDEAGRLSSQLDANGQTTSYSYTSRSDVASVHYPAASVAFEYDANQQPIAMTDTLGVTGWTYDAAGRQLSQVDASGARLAYTYDAAGRLSSLGMPSGDAIGYEYDKAGRPVATTSPWGTLAYDWDAAGNLTTQDRSTGVSTTYAYDAVNRVTQIAHAEPVAASATASPLPSTAPSAPVTAAVSSCASASGYLASRTVPETGSPDDCVKTDDYLTRRTAPAVPNPLEAVTSLTFDYAYDASGNVTSATRTLAPAPAPSIAPTDARTYAYDTLNRLTGSTRSDGSTTSYAYDPAGNRTGVSTSTPGGGTTQTATFNPANQLLATSTATPEGAIQSSYAYDPNGNRTSQTESGTTTSYAYQSDGRLTGVSREGRSSTYAYDGLGRQASATETTPHGSSTSTTVWNGAVPVQRSAPTATTALVTDALGELALQADVGDPSDPSDPSASDAAWSLLDRLGSTVAQSVGGSITQLATFDDWGTQSFDTTSWSAPVGFTGESSDPGYNLNTYLARTYDPTTCTWLAQDSWRGLLTQPQSAARYAYTTNSPTTLIDVNGNRPSDPSAIVPSKKSTVWSKTPESKRSVAGEPVDIGPDPSICSQPSAPCSRSESITKRHTTQGCTRSQSQWGTRPSCVSTPPRTLDDVRKDTATGMAIVADLYAANPELRSFRNLPVSVVGWTIGTSAGAACSPGPDGMTICSGAGAGFGGKGTMYGEVFVTPLALEDVLGNDDLLEHEARHSAQWAALGADVFTVLYLIQLGESSAVSGNPGCTNWFEQDADLDKGGYEDC